MSSNNDFLIGLGYDPTDAQKGLEKALDDLSNFKVQAAQKFAELTQTQAALTANYTAASLKASRDRAAAISKEIQDSLAAYQRGSASQQELLAQKIRDLNDEYLANQKILNGYNQEIERVNALKASYTGLQSQIKSTQAAKGVLSGQARGEGGVFGKALGSLNVGEVLQATGVLGLGASIPFAVHDLGKRLKEEVMDLGEYSEQLTLASEKTGMTVHELQEFDAVGKSVGLTTEDMVTAMRKFSEASVAASQAERQGNTKGMTETAARDAELMKSLGVTVLDTAGKAKSTQEVFLQLADAFQKLPDGATKSRVAVELLGRSGLNLIPFLDKGRQGLSEIMTQFDGFLPDLTKTAEEFEQVRIAQAEYDAASQSLKASLAEGVLPVLATMYENIAGLINLMSKTGIVEGFGFALKRALGVEGAPPVSGEEANKTVSLLLGNKNATVDRSEFQKRSEAFQALLHPSIVGEAFHPGTYGTAFGLAANGTFAAAQAEYARRFPQKNRVASPEELAALSLILEKRYQIVDSVKQENAEQDKLQQKIQHILNDTTKTGGAQRDASQKAREAVLRTAGVGEEKLANLRLGQILTPEGLNKNETQSTSNQLAALQKQSVSLTGEQLLENLRQQNELTRQLYDLKVKIVEEEKKSVEETQKLAQAAAEEMDKAAMAQRKELESSIAFSPITKAAQPSAPGGYIKPGDVAGFQGQLETLSASRQVGLETPTAEIAALDQLDQKIKDEITSRLQAKDITAEQLKQLQQMVELAKKVGEEIKAAGKETPFGQFVEQVKTVSETISKFSPGFKKSPIALYAAGIEGLGNFGQTVMKAGGGKEGEINFGQFLKGLKEIFGNTTKFLSSLPSIMGPLMPFIQGNQGVGGAVAGASMGGGLSSMIGDITKALGGTMPGPVGAAITLGGAALGGIFGMGQKKAANVAKDIKNQVNQILDALRAGSQGIGETIQKLEQQRDEAVAQLSGSKSGKKELQSLLPQLDQQIADLQGQQKQLLDQFHQNLAALEIPEDAGRSTVQQIEQIASALKQAAMAGASAADQMAYLNVAMNDLKVSVGKDILDEEQQTLDLLQKEIQLQQQRTDIINQAYAQQRQVQDSLALSRAFTPAQSAALQIREIGIQRDQQIQQLDQQDAVLKAQIDGQAQLFGWSLKDLQSADAKTKLLAQQVELQKELTAQTIAQITANQSFLAQLNAGNIPNLPAGALPSGFSWPTGGAYGPAPAPGTSPTGPTINITINAGPGSSGKDISDALSQMIRVRNLNSAFGFQ